MSDSVSLPPRLSILAELDNPFTRPEHFYASEFGLSDRDVPGLVELAKLWADPEHYERNEDSPSLWAPIHAWLALGELRAEVLVPTLLGMLDKLDELGDQCYLELFPELCGRVGPAALPELMRYMNSGRHKEYGRIAAAHGLKAIVEEVPEARSRVVDVLGEAIEHYDRDAVDLNAFLISYLVDLKAIEYSSPMERAFQAGVVNTMVCGEWPELEHELRTGRRRAWQGTEPTPARRSAPGLSMNSVGGTTYRRSKPKIGRNAPCPCDSGRKYKRCMN